MSEVRKEKERLKEGWEEIFGRKMEDSFTEEGIEHYWDENTSCEDAADMLTHAAMMDMVDDILDKVICGKADELGDVVGVIIRKPVKKAKEKQEDEPCNVKNGMLYKVAKVHEGRITHVLDDEYETEEAAKAWIQGKVNHSTCTLDDFCVFQMQVIK